MKRFNSSKWITENKHSKNLTEGMSPEEWADAKEKERLNQHPEKDTINKIKKMMDKEKEEMHDDPGDIRIDHDYYANESEVSEVDFIDDEGSHAKMQLQKATEYSAKLAVMMGDIKQLPSWVQAKITKASDYMSSVYHYLDYETSGDQEDLTTETRPDWTPPPMGMGGEDEEQDEYDKGWYGESSDYADRLANSGTDSDGRNTWGDKTGYSDEEMAQGKGKLKKYPDKDGRNVWGDKVDYSDVEKKAKGLKELAEELGYLNEVDGMEGGMDPNAMQYQKVRFVYSEQGGRFYGLDVYVSKDQPQRSAKLRYDEANEWLKDTLHYIHEDDLIPRQYGSGLEDLDLIVDRLRELDIEASHNEYDFS